ncbi:MAG TPA: GNAT family protein [Frankiaceae bacterium]|jgi:RimJ/RimL family protein N-acetyltransferase|nr:GNAT family protein [Frankiaceae bacterium]
MYAGSLVRLRAPEPRDAEDFHRWFNDPDVTGTLGVRYPLSMSVEREWVERSGVGSYTNCHFAIETLADGVLLGSCGLFETALPENRCAVLGVTLGNKEYWGRGYGTDTVRTLCRFGFGEMNLHRIELLVFAHNAAARRVYAKVGFVEEAVARQAHWGDGEWWDDVHMALLEGELR